MALQKETRAQTKRAERQPRVQTKRVRGRGGLKR
jgi:hypothetical protein